MEKTPKTAQQNASEVAAPVETTPMPFLELRRAGVDGRDINTAPSQWGRRLARLVGEKYGVQMEENLARNEGVWRGKDIAIKCAKSTMPPISVLHTMIDRLDLVWAVYVMPNGGAQVWSVPINDVVREGYLTRGTSASRRVEIYLKKIERLGELIGELSPVEVESCHIP